MTDRLSDMQIHELREHAQDMMKDGCDAYVDPDELVLLLDEVERLRAECDRIERDLAKIIASVDGGLDADGLRAVCGLGDPAEAYILPNADIAKGRISFAHWAATVFAVTYRDWLECEGGENYIELQLQDPRDGKRFTVTARHIEGEYPGEKAARLESERDLYRDEVERLREVNSRYHQALDQIEDLP